MVYEQDNYIRNFMSHTPALIGGLLYSLVHEIQAGDITWIPVALLSLQTHRALFHLLQDVL
jgi:hypothetical protein